MKILLQTCRRTHLDNLRPVWEELRLRGHELFLWIFRDAELSYDREILKNWSEGGWRIIEGDYQRLIFQKDHSMVRHILETVKPDILLPLKHTTSIWKETTRAMDLKPWAGKVITFQDSFSVIRGKLQSTAPLPTPSQSTIPWFLVWGEHYKKKLIYNGYPADRIIVTGNPAWDWCDLGKLPPPRYVLFLGGAPQDWLPGIDFRQIYHEFFTETFIFKDHPVQADKKYSLIQGLTHLKMYPNKRIKVFNSKTATELIQEAKVVITTTSSCAIEAMLCGKPVIIVNTCKESEKFESSGRMIPWTHFSFSRELRACLQGKEDRSRIPGFVQYAVHKPDGKAFQRMADEIERIGKVI